jgi:hypothetical protein
VCRDPIDRRNLLVALGRLLAEVNRLRTEEVGL